MSTMSLDEELRWVPTHVQVTVLRARGLRAKGKHGTSDVYTIIQVGKEKYSTCVAEKTTEPEWREECSFELLSGLLEEGGRSVYPPGSCDLTLTVMHRALIGLDVFLGQAVIPLDKAFQERICKKNEWCRLHSKTGKKEKERGELQVTLQFTRHNLTASMFDLSMKDKPLSAFDKLRERMRGKKRSAVEGDSSSAIVSGGYGTVVHTRHRLPSDGGGEEDYEDDEGGEGRRSKMRSFFLRGRLRKSSDTRSSTSLGSESSESSSRGGSLSPTAGISVVVSDLSNSPSNSSNLTADNSPDHTVAPSPQVSPVRHVCDDDHSFPVPQALMGEMDTPILLPSVCVNGNPVDTSPQTPYPPTLQVQLLKPQTQTQPPQVEPSKPAQTVTHEPQQTKPQIQRSAPETQTKEAQPRESEPQPVPTAQDELEWKPKVGPDPLALPSTLGLLQKGSTFSLSLQNLSQREQDQPAGCPVDGRRWSFDKPGEEEKAAIAAALEHAGKVTLEQPTESIVSTEEVEIQGKKRRGLFSHGRSETVGKGPTVSKEEASRAPAEGKPSKSWFSSKDSHSKPSPLKDLCTDKTFSPSPFTPTDPWVDALPKHTNPFTPPPLSHANPFLCLLKQNPFFPELHSASPLTTTMLDLPSLSSTTHYPEEGPASGLTLSTVYPECTWTGQEVEKAVGAGSQMVPLRPDESEWGHVFMELSEGRADGNTFQGFADDQQKPPEMSTLQKRPMIASFPLPPTNKVSSSFDEAPTESIMPDGTNHSQASYLELVNTTPECPSSKTRVIPSTSTQNSGTESSCTNNNSVKDEISLLHHSQSSLPQDSNLSFGELHELASPYPLLVNLPSSETNVGLDLEDEERALFMIEDMHRTPSSSAELSSDDTLEPSSVESTGQELDFLSSVSTQVHLLKLSLDPPVQMNSSYQDTLVFASVEGGEEKNSNHLVEPELPSLQGEAGNGKTAQQCNEAIDKGATPLIGSLIQTDMSSLGSLKELPKDGQQGRHETSDQTSEPQQNLSESYFKQAPLPSGYCEVLEVEFQQLDIGDTGHQSVRSLQSSIANVNSDVGMEEAALKPDLMQSSSSHLFQSLYVSADSERYLTCGSQQSSMSHSLPLSQDAVPIDDTWLQTLRKCDTIEDALPNKDTLQEAVQIHAQTAMPHSDLSQAVVMKPEPLAEALVGSNDLQRCDLSQEASSKHDFVKQAVPSRTVRIEAVPQFGPSLDIMPKHESNFKSECSHEMIEVEGVDGSGTEMEKEDQYETYLSKPDLFQGMPLDDSPALGYIVDGRHTIAHSTKDCPPLNTEIDQPAELSDCLQELTSSVSQDLVISDMENIFIPRCPETHFNHAITDMRTSQSPVPQPESTETDTAIKPEPVEILNRSPATVAALPQASGLCSDGLSQALDQVFPPQPLGVDRPSLALSSDLALNFCPLLNLSPLAASTPFVAPETNVQPGLFSFPSIHSAQKTTSTVSALAATPCPPAQPEIGAQHASFLQETQQAAYQHSSPHPVKPLTPPDEKRSEGRSVLEKLKSTISTGRGGHHGDQEVEKSKSLVEGGGAYYHLSHSELVSLLLQREVELQQERAEFEHRGAVLEKREAELKKMKFMIKDLEDYIDTLLVRIMEQTPTLLQVRTKLK